VIKNPESTGVDYMAGGIYFNNGESLVFNGDTFTSTPITVVDADGVSYSVYGGPAYDQAGDYDIFTMPNGGTDYAAETGYMYTHWAIVPQNSVITVKGVGIVPEGKVAEFGVIVNYNDTITISSNKAFYHFKNALRSDT
jgi:hypothetical protein